MTTVRTDEQGQSGFAAAPGPTTLRHTRHRMAVPFAPAGDRHADGDGGSIDDVLVFEQSDRGDALIGGRGRGDGWAGIVEIPPDDASLVGRAWRSGTLVRHSSGETRQVAGPYHAGYAASVPVGDKFVVVFGAKRPITMRDNELVRLGVDAVDRTHEIPPDKLLADELELVHAVRALMAYRPETVRDTVRHVATVAAEALSCQVALIQVQTGTAPVIESVFIPDRKDAGATAEAAAFLARAVRAPGPVVEQSTAADGLRSVFGLAVASQMTLPIGGAASPAGAASLGALSIAHASDRARGFTSLCQRIGRALAESAELLISQAIAREDLARERDRLVGLTETDALTGVANRRAWDEAGEQLAGQAGSGGFVISCDVDGLKQVNDRYGHAAGDTLLRGAANLLQTVVRETDLLARVGGDEFAIILAAADAGAARRVVRRLRRAERVWRVTEFNLQPRLSVGMAEIEDGSLEDAKRIADARMYANKRRRASR